LAQLAVVLAKLAVVLAQLAVVLAQLAVAGLAELAAGAENGRSELLTPSEQ
jgi:hypothetical protein